MLVVALLLGLVVGSFLNVVVHRLPRGESIVFPGSRCPSCSAAIRPWDNVPVLSWLALRGRCRACGARISLRYPALEAATGLVFLALAARYGASLQTLLLMAFAAALLAAALIDFDHQIIPDELSLGGLLVGLVAVPLLAVRAGADPGHAFWNAAAGALLGGGLLWSVGFLHARLSVALGRRFPHWPGEGEAPPRPASLDYWTWFPGMGFGDVKLLAMVGAFLGPAGVLETIFAACFVGLFLGLASAAATRSWSMPFGFGPAIALGALAVLLSPVHWLRLAVLLSPVHFLALA
jgi:leader peptidase (prepilin peptidase)/N-methyltransferase